jgi:hypothetical protein
MHKLKPIDRRLALGTIPPLIVCVIYELFLGHRHDYTGHFAAGYGGTYAAYMVYLRLIPDKYFGCWGLRSLIPACLVCILLGALAEATAFRIARFDEIDFFNQSLGAVLAAVVVVSYADCQRPPDREFDYGVIVAIVYLSLGGCFAVA